MPFGSNLECCGAFHKFHRHGFSMNGEEIEDDVMEPEQCFKGPHTTDPSNVKSKPESWVPGEKLVAEPPVRPSSPVWNASVRR